MTVSTASAILNTTDFPPATLPVIADAPFAAGSATWSSVLRAAFKRSVVGKVWRLIEQGLSAPPAMAESPANMPVVVVEGNGEGRGFIHTSSQGFGSVFGYMASPWAIMCIFMTIVLNRTTLYASLRRPLRLPLRIRLLLRVLPIVVLVIQVRNIAYSLRCQTSPNTGIQGDAELGGFLYWVARGLSFWESDDRKICTAASLAPPSLLGLGEDPKDFTFSGSLNLLWPLYTTLAYSQFIETLSCALSGRSPAAETGMTFFEHSVAFAQAEAMSVPSPFVDRQAWTAAMGPVPRNIAPEVLYIALISACGHLTSQLLGLGGKQARYRLYATGFWGCAVLLGFAWALSGAWQGGVAVMRMRSFPTVCVVGFIPHLIIVLGILMCFSIYLLALLISSLSPPPTPNDRRSVFRPSLTLGFQNLQANITLSNITLNPSEDFYTSLLKLGFLILFAASEATYLNEGRPIVLPGLTWLEVERLRLLEKEKSWQGNSQLAPHNSDSSKSPYVIERNGFAQEIAHLKDKGRAARGRTSGSRWRAAGEIVRGTFVVAARWGVFNIVKVFRPEAATERQAVGQVVREEVERYYGESSSSSRFEGSMAAPEEEVDQYYGEEDEASNLYKRFLSGNLPDFDSDSDYIPEDEESSEDEPSDSDEEPSRHRSFSLEPSLPPSTSLTLSNPSEPLPTLLSTPENLASLLDPKSPSARRSAKLLAQHLTSTTPLTRRQFHDRQNRDDRLVYRGLLPRLTHSSSSTNPSEEASILESVLLERRSAVSRQNTPGPSSSHSDEQSYNPSEGGIGPLCVVCQSAPRTILVWPCRCLALCEECRVSLAVNNFGTCVCCRGELAGFSRIYIP